MTDTTDGFAAAFVAALGELDDIGKNQTATAGQYSYRYADLATVLGQVRPVLARHGLAVAQNVSSEPSGNAVAVEVWTTILHTGGGSRESPALRLTTANDPQKLGSATSYLRRYSLMAALGIAAGSDDDDGVSARQPSPPPRPNPPPTPPRTAAEGAIREMLAAVDDPDVRQRVREGFTAEFGMRLGELDPERHDEALTWVTGQLDDAQWRADADVAHRDD